MKRKILFAITLAVFLTATTNAQIEKKDWLLGGTIGLNTASANSTSNVNLAPHIGYALGNNSVIGMNLSFNYSTANYVAEKQHNLGLNSTVFFRKYFTIKENFGWYSGFYAGGGFSFDKQIEADSTHTTTKNQNWNLRGGFIPGIYYKATQYLLVTVDFGGIGYMYSNGYGRDGSSVTLNFLSSFTFGVDFILGKHKS